jgi:hypothetical protein
MERYSPEDVWFKELSHADRDLLGPYLWHKDNDIQFVEKSAESSSPVFK